MIWTGPSASRSSTALMPRRLISCALMVRILVLLSVLLGDCNIHEAACAPESTREEAGENACDHRKRCRSIEVEFAALPDDAFEDSEGPRADSGQGEREARQRHELRCEIADPRMVECGVRQRLHPVADG